MSTVELSAKERASIKFHGIPFTLSCGHPDCNKAYPTHECKEGEIPSTTPGFKTVFIYKCPKGHQVLGVELV